MSLSLVLSPLHCLFVLAQNSSWKMHTDLLEDYSWKPRAPINVDSTHDQNNSSTELLPFHNLTQPSSPEDASTVPVIFQLTRQT